MATDQEDAMMTLRRSHERGFADHGWLKSFHSFSFANYYDPQHMGWGNLRVINEDRIAAGGGFGAHPHRDMEIISYVLQGQLAHQDSLGNRQTIVPGEVQRMTAGTGVVHSEHNATPETTHFLQIWLLPAAHNLAPGYEQKAFSDAEKTNRWRLVAAPDGAQGAVQLHADARLYASLLRPAPGVPVAITQALPPGRKGYVFVVEGALQLNGHHLGPGDAALLEDETDVQVLAREAAHVLLFDLAP